MSTKYFVFLFPKPGKEKTFLDLAIYVLNPVEKWPAHITVAGPFSSKRDFRITTRRYEADVLVFGGANFFRFGSPTVYLNAGFKDLDLIWNKPDFRSNPIPHVTIYDGKDIDFATKVFDMVRECKRQFFFRVDGLHAIKSISGQYRSDLRLSADLNALDITKGMSHEEVVRLSVADRIAIARKALAQLS